MGNIIAQLEAAKNARIVELEQKLAIACEALSVISTLPIGSSSWRCCAEKTLEKLEVNLPTKI